MIRRLLDAGLLRLVGWLLRLSPVDPWRTESPR